MIGSPCVRGCTDCVKGIPVSDRASDYTPGEGWLLFAGVMLFLAGVLNVIWGIAAIDDSAFFTDEGRYILFDDLNAWGWFFLIVGILQVVAAISIWNGGAFGALLGVICAAAEHIDPAIYCERVSVCRVHAVHRRPVGDLRPGHLRGPRTNELTPLNRKGMETRCCR